MLKIYDVKWTSPRSQPESLHWPPGVNVLWCNHTTNDNSREIGVFTTRVSTGLIAAESVQQVVDIVNHEFPGSIISSVAEFDSLPFMSPDAPTRTWAIERYNYFANTGRLLPSTTLFANGSGYSCTTVSTAPELPMYHNVEIGTRYPYDGRELPPTVERSITLGILSDLSDRRGIKWELEKVDGDIRIELVDDLTAIVKSMLNK